MSRRVGSGMTDGTDSWDATWRCRGNVVGPVHHHHHHHHHHNHHTSWSQCPLTSDACFAIFCQLFQSRAEWLSSCRFASHHSTTSSVHRLAAWTSCSWYHGNVWWLLWLSGCVWLMQWLNRNWNSSSGHRVRFQGRATIPFGQVILYTHIDSPVSQL